MLAPVRTRQAVEEMNAVPRKRDHHIAIEYEYARHMDMMKLRPPAPTSRLPALQSLPPHVPIHFMCGGGTSHAARACPKGL